MFDFTKLDLSMLSDKRTNRIYHAFEKYLHHKRLFLFNNFNLRIEELNGRFYILWD